MTTTLSKPRFNFRKYLPALCVFTLPWLADIIILSGSHSAAGTTTASGIFEAPVGLVLNALYAAAPFALMASAMRPRPRVSRALWGGAVLTALLWSVYAFAGRAAEGARVVIDDTFVKPLEYVTPPSGELFLVIFIVLMIWPCIVTVLMGVAAKFKEAPLAPDTGANISDGA